MRNARIHSKSTSRTVEERWRVSASEDHPFNEGQDRQEVGKLGESLAKQHLVAKGYVVLCQNWRAKDGEIDLIVKDEEQIVFVEVKTRTSHAYGWPEESITPSKRRHMQKAAWEYLDAQKMMDADWRMDVIAIDLTSSGNLERLEHYQYAVGDEGDLG